MRYKNNKEHIYILLISIPVGDFYIIGYQRLVNIVDACGDKLSAFLLVFASVFTSANLSK